MTVFIQLLKLQLVCHVLLGIIVSFTFCNCGNFTVIVSLRYIFIFIISSKPVWVYVNMEGFHIYLKMEASLGRNSTIGRFRFPHLPTHLFSWWLWYAENYLHLASVLLFAGNPELLFNLFPTLLNRNIFEP